MGNELETETIESKMIKLPEREAQVVGMAAQGMTDKEIAAALAISQETVSTYWRRVLLRYGAVSRTEVVAKVAEQKVREKLQAAAAENAQLLDEIAERTRAQARELAQRNLLEAVTEASLGFLSKTAAPRDVFENLLERVLALTESEYGFIGEVFTDPLGNPYLKTHAITDISWNDETRELYEKNVAAGLEFRNLDTLFGHVLSTRQIVIANDPSQDPRAGGTPHGHPPLNAFLGIPFLRGDELVGVIGIANCPNGYSESTARYLEPMVATCASLIHAYRTEQARSRAEKLLAESSVRIEALMEHAGMAVVFEDATRRILYCNAAFPAIFKLDIPAHHLVGLDCRNLAVDAAAWMADPDAFTKRLDELFAAHVPCENDVLRLADGRQVLRSFYPVMVDSAHIGYLWTLREDPTA